MRNSLDREKDTIGSSDSLVWNTPIDPIDIGSTRNASKGTSISLRGTLN